MANFAHGGGQNMRVIGHSDMVRLLVRGRGAHIATALSTVGWSKGPAVTILAKCESAGQQIYEAIGGLTGGRSP